MPFGIIPDLAFDFAGIPTRRETVNAVAFNTVSRVAALETCIPWVLAVTCQTLPVLPTPACRKISAPFRLGFADLAVISERWVHCRVSKPRVLNLQSAKAALSSQSNVLAFHTSIKPENTIPPFYGRPRGSVTI
jgi:hypothetical protein